MSYLMRAVSVRKQLVYPAVMHGLVCPNFFAAQCACWGAPPSKFATPARAARLWRPWVPAILFVSQMCMISAGVMVCRVVLRFR